MVAVSACYRDSLWSSADNKASIESSSHSFIHIHTCIRCTRTWPTAAATSLITHILDSLSHSASLAELKTWRERERWKKERKAARTWNWMWSLTRGGQRHEGWPCQGHYFKCALKVMEGRHEIKLDFASHRFFCRQIRVGDTCLHASFRRDDGPQQVFWSVTATWQALVTTSFLFGIGFGVRIHQIKESAAAKRALRVRKEDDGHISGKKEGRALWTHTQFQYQKRKWTLEFSPRKKEQKGGVGGPGGKRKLQRWPMLKSQWDEAPKGREKALERECWCLAFKTFRLQRPSRTILQGHYKGLSPCQVGPWAFFSPKYLHVFCLQNWFSCSQPQKVKK